MESTAKREKRVSRAAAHACLPKSTGFQSQVRPSYAVASESRRLRKGDAIRDSLRLAIN